MELKAKSCYNDNACLIEVSDVYQLDKRVGVSLLVNDGYRDCEAWVNMRTVKELRDYLNQVLESESVV